MSRVDILLLGHRVENFRRVFSDLLVSYYDTSHYSGAFLDRHIGLDAKPSKRNHGIALLDECCALPEEDLCNNIDLALAIAELCNPGVKHDDDTERAIKPFAIGRKNRLFGDAPRGAHASAAICSAVAAAPADGLNPRLCVERLPTETPSAARWPAMRRRIPSKAPGALRGDCV